MPVPMLKSRVDMGGVDVDGPRADVAGQSIRSTVATVE